MTPASSDVVPTVGCCSLRVLLSYYVTFGVLLGIAVTARGDHMTTWEQSPSTGTPCACAKPDRRTKFRSIFRSTS